MTQRAGTETAERPHAAADATPLVVDLDGTLVRTDTLAETVVGLVALGPAGLRQLLRGLAALPRGRAAAKAALAEAFTPDPALLPWRPAALAALREARGAGRPVVLATAADRRVAEAAAAHLGLFDAVLASDGERNLDGRGKAALLAARFGEAGFDYLGDRAADLPVWAAARRAMTAGAGPRLRARVERAARRPEAVRHLDPAPGLGRRLGAWIRAVRPHQWSKNLLVFLPLVAVHGRAEGGPLAAAVAFAAFSMIASSAYLLNDLLDLAADRAHPRKRRRPFAAGELPLARGALAAAALLAAGLATAAALSWPLAAAAAAYAAATLAYSLALKREMVIDVCMLGGLYTLRVIGGAVATGVHLSPWMLAMSGFLFFSLAAMKRQVELVDARRRGREPAGRAYRLADLEVVTAMAVSAGFVSVLVSALWIYTRPVTELYESPLLLWTAPAILLFWLLRLVVLAERGRLDDDPVLFALRDPISHLCGLGVVGFALAAKLL